MNNTEFKNMNDAYKAYYTNYILKV